MARHLFRDGRAALLPRRRPDGDAGSSMAGHSQFKNIMHRKGKQDAVRSKLFSKLAREITVAAKQGLPDPNMNPRLRAGCPKQVPGGRHGRHLESGRAQPA